MKLKRIFCGILSAVMMVMCLNIGAAAADVEVQSADIPVVYASGRFSMSVPANKTVKANSSFPLEAGEVVTIKATYSPFSSSVDFGLIAPDGLFYGLNTTTGSFDKGIQVNQHGYYTLAIRNRSSVAIHVSGYVNY